jgi:phosphatidylserine/phosphatidylglycerophosphate/cardiolipin synthase-like enzyme
MSAKEDGHRTPLAGVMTSITGIDDAVGEAIERLGVAHHRRRLRRAGWVGSLDETAGSFASAGARPRSGNLVEVLVDGAEVLPRIAAAIRGARRSVHLAGWFFTPDFELTRTGERVVLVELLAELPPEVEVRVLAWAGAPVPLFTPDRRTVRAVADAFPDRPNVRFAVDPHERPLHCHHEKLVIIDDELAFVGGVDLTTLQGDRYDESTHRVRDGLSWHDAACALRGPAVADVCDHFALRWRAVTGESLAPAAVSEPCGPTRLQVARTVPENVYPELRHGDFSILGAYTAALRSAQSLVYLENQFLWSREIVAILAEKLRSPPTPEFRVVVLLPASPSNGADDTRGQLGILAEADSEAHRFLACALYSLDSSPPRPVYVHAKIGIVDDRWLTLGSANLNEHSLFNDSEVNLVADDPELARATRLRLWAEHLECDAATLEGHAHVVVDELWRPRAAAGLDQLDSGGPMRQRLVRLRGVSRRSRRFLGPLQGLVVDG